jgi:hypothetical protein
MQLTCACHGRFAYDRQGLGLKLVAVAQSHAMSIHFSLDLHPTFGPHGTPDLTSRPLPQPEPTMPFFPTMRIEQTQILTRRELACVLQHGQKTRRRSANSWRNLIIVRLACCCGLRVSEIVALQLGDVFVEPFQQLFMPLMSRAATSPRIYF